MVYDLRFVVDGLTHVELADVATDSTFFDCVCTVVEVAHDQFLTA
jgi:hypothetical protein